MSITNYNALLYCAKRVENSYYLHCLFTSQW